MQRAEIGPQRACRVVTQEQSRRKVVSHETSDGARTPSRWRWQPGENRERLERGVAGQAEHPGANGVDYGGMVLVICDDERDGIAGINQCIGFEARRISGGRRQIGRAHV